MKVVKRIIFLLFCASIQFDIWLQLCLFFFRLKIIGMVMNERISLTSNNHGQNKNLWHADRPLCLINVIADMRNAYEFQKSAVVQTHVAVWLCFAAQEYDGLSSYALCISAYLSGIRCDRHIAYFVCDWALMIYIDKNKAISTIFKA